MGSFTMHLVTVTILLTCVLGLVLAQDGGSADYDYSLIKKYYEETNGKYEENKFAELFRNIYGEDFNLKENILENDEDLEEDDLQEDYLLEDELQEGDLMRGLEQNYMDSGLLEDSRLTTTGLIMKYGYAAELHKVETSDGYILEVHRMFKSDTDPTHKPIVFLMHGLLSSSADWVNMGPHQGLGYYFANLGYDVWMGNARGNRYSRKHKKRNPRFTKFWNFSWHEIGKIDVPAMIDFVLKKTKQKKLHYVGHSQGTTAFWVMCSLLPEYNKKISSMHALAPIAFMKNMRSPLVRLLAFFDTMLGGITAVFGSGEFLPNNKLLALTGRIFCQDSSITQGMCSNIMFLLGGYNKDQLNATMIPVILGHTPAGASTKQIVHYVQEVKSGKFRQYDYGRIKNKRVYGKPKPPEYDLKKVTAPVHLYWSDNDLLAEPVDVKQLADTLPNVQVYHHVIDPFFTHLDFMWAIDVVSYVYDHVLTNLVKFL